MHSAQFTVSNHLQCATRTASLGCFYFIRQVAYESTRANDFLEVGDSGSCATPLAAAMQLTLFVWWAHQVLAVTSAVR
jgi:hypothetical protein